MRRGAGQGSGMGQDDADELVELWARLERLKVGIGGWIITGATMPPERARAENVDGRIRELIDTAIEVRARITELSEPPARHARTGLMPRPSESPLSPATGIPVIEPDLPDLPDLPERISRQQRDVPAHRDGDSGRRSA